MQNQFTRTALLLGDKAMEKIANATIAVFGVGGVGGYVVEALARSGVSHFVLVDNDTVSITNINRQIIATLDTVGKLKVDVMKDRILSINKDAIVETYPCFFLPSNQDEFNFKSYTYIVDAIDTVTAKIALIQKANEDNVPIISSMGAGNKLNPQGFKVTDISKTKVDPLAKVMRRELKKRGINKLKVVYSEEEPIKIDVVPEEIRLEMEKSGKRQVPGSNAFVPSSAGLLIASEVVKDLIK